MKTVVLGTLVVLAGSAAGAAAQDYRSLAGSRQRQGESDLLVEVEFAVGDLALSPAPAGMLYRYNLFYDAEHFDPLAKYDAQVRRLRVGIENRSHVQYRRPGDRSPQRLELALSPEATTRLDLQFGAGTADVELGGLSMSELAMKSGASQTTVRFSQPNRISCTLMRVDAGAIDLSVLKLGNARCSSVELKGAAGKVVLDLSGQWPEEAANQLDISLALGSLTLRLPETLGLEATVNRFLVFDRSGLLRRGSSYYSANWETAKAKLRLTLKAAVGEVEVEWVR